MRAPNYSCLAYDISKLLCRNSMTWTVTFLVMQVLLYGG